MPEHDPSNLIPALDVLVDSLRADLERHPADRKDTIRRIDVLLDERLRLMAQRDAQTLS